MQGQAKGPSRPVTFTSNQTWKVYPDWPSTPPDGPALETHDTFDGTGQLAKHVNTTREDGTVDYGDGNYFYWLNEDTTTTYRSSSSWGQACDSAIRIS